MPLSVSDSFSCNICARRLSLKRLFAILGILLLFGIYAMTLVFVLIGSEMAMTAFKASLLCTIAVPCLLYAMVLVYKILSKK